MPFFALKVQYNLAQGKRTICDTLGKYSIPLVCALLGQHEFRKGESELGHSIVFFTNSYIASLVLILPLGQKVK